MYVEQFRDDPVWGGFVTALSNDHSPVPQDPIDYQTWGDNRYRNVSRSLEVIGILVFFICMYLLHGFA